MSGRERRLLAVLGAIVVIALGYFLFFGGDDVEIEGLDLPQASPSAVVASPTVSPTFAVPVGARDPFKP